MAMDWTRSDTLGIANHDCVRCHGLGLLGGRLSSNQPCNCVLRAIFRICFEKFCQLATQEKRLSQVTLDGAGPQCRRVVWGRKDEEYMADFLAMARRTLDEQENRIFRYHFLLGANWRMCCERLGIEKGEFFHSVYRIEQKVGRALRETKPYGLYPLDEYFSGVRVEHKSVGRNTETSRNVIEIPLRREQQTQPRLQNLPVRKVA